MNDSVIFLTSYVVNAKTVVGSFPVYVKEISQCCIDENGVLTIEPITINQE
jgi:hypothetical protein